MKTKYRKILNPRWLFLIWISLFASCQKYLDKAPEAVINQGDIFKNFTTYQGFVEDMYQDIVDVTLGPNAFANWNWGDDVYLGYTSSLSRQFDNGNSLAWSNVTAGGNPFVGNISSVDNIAKGQKGYWNNGWYGIRTANMAIQHIGELVDATEEERNLILGQAYFFRAYLHFEILRAWGGIPYIETVFSPTDKLNLPRLTYAETAAKITEDLKRAAALLPDDWDNIPAGQKTVGLNKGRITKGICYGYLGKNLLYAASPLMNGVETGSYTYNEDLCKQAADAFMEVIKLHNQGVYALEPWNKYSTIFYRTDGTRPLGKEIIFSNPIYLFKRYDYGEETLTNLGGWGLFASPTQNYVKYFGMANGLPIDEADAGFNPANPWTNRDPRFYYNIHIDGEKQVKNTVNADTYTEFFTGGRHRNPSNCMTGFGTKKFKDVLTFNQWDNGWGEWSPQTFFRECPKMRLADIYLMYAEAVNEAYGPTATTPGGLTAVQAVNIVRTRATVPDVDPRFFTKDKFRETIRRERAVELAFENHRWYDIRRWYVAHLPQYKDKLALDFDKGHTFFNEFVLISTAFDLKHYWLPFSNSQVTLYPEFKQNPGW